MHCSALLCSALRCSAALRCAALRCAALRYAMPCLQLAVAILVEPRERVEAAQRELVVVFARRPPHGARLVIAHEGVDCRVVHHATVDDDVSRRVDGAQDELA